MTRSSLPLWTRCSKFCLVAALFLVLTAAQQCHGAYYGKLIGRLSELHHKVSGEVYAVDGRTLYIKDFTYDGEGPAAFFYAGNSKNPNGNGFRVRDEHGTTNVLKRYRKKDITLTLPEGKTLNNIKWFSVWCDEFSVNFGDVKIPRGFDYPRPQKLAALNGVHGVSSEPVVVVDAQTLLIPGFSYDGEAPDAKFWVGPGPSPTPQGIRVPDENGKVVPLRRYDRKTIVLTLPDDLTIHQLGHFGVWCEAFTVDFGHVKIPQGLNVPPSLKMLGVSPQSKLNCEVLEDNLAFEVRWAVAGDSIVIQLVGKLDAGKYMSFGLSPNTERSIMVGGDVVVAWVDKQTLQGYAVDYFLDAKSQCSGGRGSCPDTRIQENTNSVRLLNAAMVNGYSIVTYQRPLKASDELDQRVRTNGSQAIIWAIGPLNERNEVSFHSDYLKTTKLIEFGRPPAWNCPMPDQDQDQDHKYNDNEERESNAETHAVTTRPRNKPATPAPASKKDAWFIPPIECDEPEDGVLYAQLGPTGGKHGYPAITGHVGWGISWYINGLLIPEINVVRGKQYTFVVEAGLDPNIPARYHPFYITDDPVGGYQHKTPEEKKAVRIFAGVRRERGAVIPTGVGRYCNWVPDQDKEADDFGSFGAYQRTLTLMCDHGAPGIIQWTPDKDTPDTVYYQCFTHRYLGWKINVHDSCDRSSSSASEISEVYSAPDAQESDDLAEGASIRVSSKIHDRS
ncbi:protein Skeletor, isoforms B/C isoform X2 [Cephus cinctus]|uniref:Protein Skeletor, isoforms B/C isoform X2 n=1 Tax=Cephus cinctus TaxID=211228 RepID=A0AAJ7BUW6_CEPCN|nr:protein Skeletor, isoforms B/C isoform X2 [Cephus cinctus]